MLLRSERGSQCSAMAPQAAIAVLHDRSAILGRAEVKSLAKQLRPDTPAVRPVAVMPLGRAAASHDCRFGTGLYSLRAASLQDEVGYSCERS